MPDIPGTARLSALSTAARRCRLDVNSTLDQADNGPRKGLFQPPLFQAALSQHALALRNGPIQRRQQGLGLAKFRRPLMADAVDGAHQQPKPDFLRQTNKAGGIESKARGVAAIP